jgi:uncharacterized protein YihD (DUF1040 family)
MRDQKRIKRILKLLNSLWQKEPDLRFFQLAVMLQDMIIKNDYHRGLDCFYLEDKVLEEFLLFITKPKEEKILDKNIGEVTQDHGLH